MEKKRYEVFEKIKIIGSTNVFRDYFTSSILYLAVSLLSYGNRINELNIRTFYG